MIKGENNEWLKDYIEELKEILEMDEFPDLESKFTFAEYLGSCEEWFENGTPVKSASCSLCGGGGKLHDYENEWQCHSCFGTGISVYPA